MFVAQKSPSARDAFAGALSMGFALARVLGIIHFLNPFLHGPGKPTEDRSGIFARKTCVIARWGVGIPTAALVLQLRVMYHRMHHSAYPF
ncbi:hypothetical protein [Novipirellula galeiformis]|nr:hypothetical protein [Novipirellula galeiformis]